MSVLHIARWIQLCAEGDLALNGGKRGMTLVRWPSKNGAVTKWHAPEKVGGETRVTKNGRTVPASSRMEVLMRCGVLFADDEVAEWNVDKIEVAIDRGWLDWPSDLLAEVCGVCVHFLPRHEANWLYGDGHGIALPDSDEGKTRLLSHLRSVDGLER